ncbi:hypothetical protein AB0G02_13385 [Actinosynnema sp. NPDC023658]|uniref:hypothetical protein n=1 Tax=Actinosynnema sp. NPDC023658 TaxID=3155465 RepID=UPI0033DDA8DD
MELRRAWRSVRQGKNVELYLVLIVSVVAIVLSLADLGSPRLVQALTVTAIGLVGLALLEQRFEVREAVDRMESTLSRARFEHERPYDLDQLLRTSNVVMLAGVDLARTFSNFQRPLSDYLARGNELRVMLYDPDSPAIDHAVGRSKRPFSRQRQVQLIKDAAADFSQLRSIPNAKIQIKLSATPFPHGVVASNYHRDDGIICLKFYRYRLDNYDLPWMKLTSADGIWFTQFAKEIDVFWDDARQA